jgi:hypothetical protein
VVDVEQERDRDPREGLSSQQLSILRQMARGASRAEAAAAHGVSEERLKGWERTSWFRQALAKEKESPWTTGRLVAAGLREHTSGQLAQAPRSTSARRTMAIDLLSAGVSITEAASLVGYTRQHLSHLSNHDANFHAERERRKVEDHQRRSYGLWHVWDEALLAVKTAIMEGDNAHRDGSAQARSAWSHGRSRQPKRFAGSPLRAGAPARGWKRLNRRCY